MLRTDWKYYIDAVEVTPSGDDKSDIRYKHDDGEIFFTQEFNGELTFTGTDYLIFKADYDLGDYCKRYEFIIEQKCNHVYEVKYLGFFSLIDGMFDLDRCTYKVKPTLEDKYTCLKRNEEVTVNLLDSSLDRYVVTGDCYTGIEFYADSALQEMVLLTTVSGHWLLNNSGDYTRDLDIYAREVVVLPERITPDNSWTIWNGSVGFNNKEVPEGFKKWVRNLDSVTIVPAVGDIVVHFDDSYREDVTLNHLSAVAQIGVPITNIYTSRLYMKYTFLDTLYFLNAEIDYLNCVKLTDAINFAKDQCTGIGDLQSEFFTNATNPVTGLASKTNNIFIIQKSDAKRPSASEQATNGETTWKDLMYAVQNYFYTRWYLDDSSNLIIEHVSDINKTAGIDITVAPYNLTTAQLRRFKFDKNLIYKYEQLNIAEAKGIDFKGTSIYYSDDCTVKDGKYESKEYETGEFITDIGFIQSQPDKISDTGFVIVACDGSNKIINETGILSGDTEINGHLSVSSLQNNYWKHERIFINGNMNGVDSVFESALKLRQIEKMNIIKCCDEDFDPMQTLNTELGVANVETATFNLFSHKLELDLYV